MQACCTSYTHCAFSVDLVTLTTVLLYGCASGHITTNSSSLHIAEDLILQLTGCKYKIPI